jgi:DNA transposition AAA+ family ATPase
MLSRNEKIKVIEKYCVITHQIQEIIDDIKEQRELAKITGYEEQPNSILVTAETGMGKTKLIQEYLKKEYNQSYVQKYEGGEKTITPALYVSVPDDTGSRAAPMAILDALNDPLYAKGTRAELNIQFANKARDCGVELIIIDEFQNAIETGTDKVIYKVAEWVKTIINRTNIPVILLGMPWALDVVELNSQLESRFPIKHHIKMYGKNNFADWIKFLQKLDKKLPFDSLSGLNEPKLAYRLMAASQGKIGYLMKRIIRPAARIAVERELDNIPIKLLLEASIKYCKIPEESNPLSYQHMDINDIQAICVVSESVYRPLEGKKRAKLQDAEYASVRFDELKIADT